MSNEIQTVPLSCVADLTRNIAAVLTSVANSIDNAELGVPTHNLATVAVPVDADGKVAQAAPKAVEPAKTPEPEVKAEKPKRKRRTKAEIEAEKALLEEAKEAKHADKATKEAPAEESAEEEVIPDFVKAKAQEKAAEKPKQPEESEELVSFDKDIDKDTFISVAKKLNDLGCAASPSFANDVIPEIIAKYNVGALSEVFENGEGYEFLCDLEDEVKKAQK